MKETSHGVLASATAAEAVVLGVPEPGRVEVRLTDGGGMLTARIAVVGYDPHTGDRVLVLTNARGDGYVVGVLLASTPAARAGDVSVRVEGSEIGLYRDDGTLVLRYDAERGETVLASPGDLVLEAREGRVRIAGAQLELTAAQIVQKTESLVTEAGSIAFSTDRWELRANRLKERARDAFIDVENLMQTRAGQLRTIARRTMQLFAERTSIRSREDTAVDGKRVLLG